MSILKNGYFVISFGGSNQLSIAQKGANHETLNHSENLETDAAALKNISAAMRTSGGVQAVVVDTTGRGLTKGRQYYRAKRDLKTNDITLTSVRPADADEKALAPAPEAAATEEKTVTEPGAQQGGHSFQ